MADSALLRSSHGVVQTRGESLTGSRVFGWAPATSFAFCRCSEGLRADASASPRTLASRVRESQARWAVAAGLGGGGRGVRLLIMTRRASECRSCRACHRPSHHCKWPCRASPPRARVRLPSLPRRRLPSNPEATVQCSWCAQLAASTAKRRGGIPQCTVADSPTRGQTGACIVCASFEGPMKREALWMIKP